MGADPRRNRLRDSSSGVGLAEPALSDEQLVEQVRSGDTAAFDALYGRHRVMARHVAAAQVDNSADVDDVVADAFASVLESLAQGKGPDLFFRAYLLTAVRRTAYRANRSGSRTRPTDESYLLDSAHYHQDSVLAEFETAAVAQAFKSLPERWQAVLWYVDIEGMKPRAASPMLGLSPNGVSALALRAREGLRQAYLQNHVKASVGEDCEECSAQLGVYSRKGLSPRSERKVQSHLEECSKCTALLLDLHDVQSSMRSVLFPLIAGIAFSPAIAALASASGSAGATAAAGAAHGGMALPMKVVVGVLVAAVAGSAAVAAMGAAGMFVPGAQTAEIAPSPKPPGVTPRPTASPTRPLVPVPGETGQANPPIAGEVPALPAIWVVLRRNTNPSLPALPPAPGGSTPKEPPSLPPVLPTIAPSAPGTNPPVVPSASPSATASVPPAATPTGNTTPSPQPSSSTPTPTPTPTPTQTNPAPAVTAEFVAEPGTTASDVNVEIVFVLGDGRIPASAEVTFSLSEGSGLIPGKLIEPSGWSCRKEHDDIPELKCTSTAVDPGALGFHMGVTRKDPNQTTTMTYTFSGSGIAPTTFVDTF